MLMRRTVLQATLCLGAVPAWAQSQRAGHIMVIGGAEDKMNDRLVLRRFTGLCGGTSSRIRVLSAAGATPSEYWDAYATVFAELGVQDFAPIDIPDRAAADDSATLDQILHADGIFISGGSQRRLMALLRGTRALQAIQDNFRQNGGCIGGTSAGAAALSRNMLAQGMATRLPEKNVAALEAGMGLVPNAIIDQHFSERGRLGRLLSVLTERPELLGVGVDEDTALIIERQVGIEVIGRGAVTIVDGRTMLSNSDVIDDRERLEMLGVRLHVIPSGHRYVLNSADFRRRNPPERFVDAIRLLVEDAPFLSQTPGAGPGGLCAA